MFLWLLLARWHGTSLRYRHHHRLYANILHTTYTHPTDCATLDRDLLTEFPIVRHRRTSLSQTILYHGYRRCHWVDWAIIVRPQVSLRWQRCICLCSRSSPANLAAVGYLLYSTPWMLAYPVCADYLLRSVAAEMPTKSHNRTYSMQWVYLDLISML